MVEVDWVGGPPAVRSVVCFSSIPASLSILGRDPEHQIAPDASISVCVCVIVC